MGKGKDKGKGKGKSKSKVLGILKVKVVRGINLAVRDSNSNTSDPYVVISVGHKKRKTHVVSDNCDPVWNEELTFKVRDLNVPITLEVYDKDKFTADDYMGDAEIDIRPYLDSKHLASQNFPPGTKLERVQPTKNNCLADESCIVWNYGRITQDMCIKLRNVECGQIDIQIEWVDSPHTSDSDD